ncbi:MAG: hypothetical protein ABSA06_09220 [Geobacteraceae bacterium]
MKRKTTMILLGIFLCTGFISFARADFDLGIKAYEEGDYATAVREFKADGSAEAQFNLALMYSIGKGVKQNHENF